MSIYKVEMQAVKGTEGVGWPACIYRVTQCDDNGDEEKDLDIQDYETHYFDSEEVRDSMSERLCVQKDQIVVV